MVGCVTLGEATICADPDRTSFSRRLIGRRDPVGEMARGRSTASSFSDH
jgi:hypothetical protein